MAYLDQEFDASTVEINTDFDPIPAGWYMASIASADLRDIKAGTGQYIAVRYDITGPAHQGRVVFGNMNIKNPNSTAEKIGREELATLMHAIGLQKVSDTDQFIGYALQIKVVIQKDDTYGDRNVIKGYKAIEQSSAPAPQMQTENPSPQAQAPAASNNPPWQRS